MTVRAALQWINPISLLEIPGDLDLSRRWGTQDAQVPDLLSRQVAIHASLVLLHPITHRRYWNAYRKIRPEGTTS